MSHKNKQRVFVSMVVLGLCATVAPDVLAIVGMPATPVSVAGVARRTVRRTAVVVY